MILMNLFENFDPSMNLYFSLNWMAMTLPIYILPYLFWLIPSRITVLFIKLMKLLIQEFKVMISFKYFSNIMIFVSLMIYISTLNFFGLIPYVFTVTSHMIYNLTLALTLWMGLMFFIIWYGIEFFLIHLTPKYAPNMLMHSMVLIEMVSLLIRPWTLTIRLTANVIAGHLLLTLFGTYMTSTINMPLVFTLMFIQNFLLFLEISMAFIQAYVYSILGALYFSEAKKDNKNKMKKSKMM